MNAAEAPANPTPGSEPPTAVPRGAEGAPLRLRRLGLDHNLTARDLGRFHGLIEPPARISETRIFHDFSIGAFSYVSGGFLYHTHIGRYCSLANGLHIGQGNHPAAWLSTHPFQYQKLKFNVGEGYPDRGRYYEDIEQGATVSPPKPTRTVIGNDVWIAHGVYVRNGVTIGDGAVVGARAVVVADVPPYAIAVGNPARVIRLRFEPEIVEALLRLRWWRLPPWRLRGLDFSKVDDCVRKLETLVEDERAHYRPRKIRVTP